MENNIYAEIIATIAGMLSTMAFIPQAYKIFITNETDDLDFFTFLLLSIIYFLWVIWGILLNSYSIIIFSIIQLFLILYINIKIYKNFNGDVSYNFREYISKFK
jgi:MtN3 and saliva related transmembrane protein